MDYRELPVYKHKEKIIEALQSEQVIIVESPTGSGKTITLPLILHEAGFCSKGIIGITQPRRIAALSITEFMQDQIEDGHDIVSVKMRFLDKTTAKTKIKVMTDGILLQELKHDPDLSQYSVLLVDEAHERSLNIDFILGMLKTIIEKRPEFRVIISSATINTDVFREYFSGSKIIFIETPVYPVEIRYAPPARTSDPELLIQSITAIVQKECSEKRPGDILIFLSGELLIKNCITALSMLPNAEKLQIMPLYGRLSHEEQKAVFPPAPAGMRKIVVATNIAETSITIDGVTIVIDSGYFKQNFYNPVTFTDALIERPVSKAGANQRKGRAGRTQPGICYRMYSKEDFDVRPLYTEEEIYRTDLSEVVLRMAELGIKDFENFDFISTPGRQNIAGAVETLNILDALNSDRSLSKIGQFMADFPLLPRLSRALVEAVYHYPSAISDTVTAISFLSTNSPYLLPQGEELEARKAHHAFRNKKGDFVSYLNLYKNFVASKEHEKFCDQYYLDLKTMNEIVSIKHQLEEMIAERGIPIGSNGSHEEMLCSVSRGLIQFVCTRAGRGMYKSLTANNIQIHPGSVMFREEPEFLVAGEVVKTSRTYARSVSPLTRELLNKIHPSLQNRLTGSKGRTETEHRDNSNMLVIGSESFRIIPLKAKKRLVVLSWEKLQKVKTSIPSLPFNLVQGLRGTVTFDGVTILTEEKLKTIFKIIPFLDLEKSFHSNKAAKSKNYHLPDDINAICSQTDIILQPAKSKKKKGMTEFMTLYTSGDGHYWLKGTLNFHTAISQSLASLEALIDEGMDLMQTEQKEKISALYRKMAGFYEE